LLNFVVGFGGGRKKKRKRRGGGGGERGQRKNEWEKKKDTDMFACMRVYM